MNTIKIGKHTYTITSRTECDEVMRAENPRTWASMKTNGIAAYLTLSLNGPTYRAKLFTSGKAELI